MAHSNLSKKHFLLVDDDADDRSLFAEILWDLEPLLTISQAQHGEELMQVLLAGQAAFPDVIFLDLNMPRKNGYECLQEIRENPDLQGLNVIVLTTSSDPKTIKTTFELGAKFFAVKPTTLQGLTKLAQDVLDMNWSAPLPVSHDIPTLLLTPHTLRPLR